MARQRYPWPRRPSASAGSDASGDWAGALFSSVSPLARRPLEDLAVPLGDADELGAAVGSSSSSGGDLGCGPGTMAACLPGRRWRRGVAPGGGVGVGQPSVEAWASESDAGVGAGVRVGGGNVTVTIGPSIGGLRVTEVAAWNVTCQLPTGSDELPCHVPACVFPPATRASGSWRSPPRPTPTGHSYRIGRVVVDAEAERRRRRPAARTDAAIGQHRCGAGRHRRTRQQESEQHDADDQKRRVTRGL